MSQAKKQIRVNFQVACFERDKSACRLCGLKSGERYNPATHNMMGVCVLTAHHITDRNQMPNGGYVASNGITVCESCHVDVEDVASGVVADRLIKNNALERLKASELYRLIGSSYEQALKDSEAL